VGGHKYLDERSARLDEKTSRPVYVLRAEPQILRLRCAPLRMTRNF
jgi:hypothetical protein